MKIAFNPSTVAALTTPPNNKDITFDLRGRNIFAQGVKFYGTDTNTWRDIKINNASIGSHTLDLRNGSNTKLTNTNGVVTINSTWRDIKINNASIGSYTLDLRNGSNTKLTNTNGVVTINSTWRPVVDNLTNNSTTSSLSAKQGKVLKALIDGKSNSDHNHDGRYVFSYGGNQMDGSSVAKNALGMTTNSGITGEQWHILQAARNSEYRWNSQIAFPTQNRNGMYYRSGLDNNSAWGNWVKLLDINNYSSTLDSRYYTESEVNSLLNAKLNRQNLSYGTWNPRGYHLAADYHYNGGDLSISESGSKIHVSVNGYFWQNKGQYRVLDTSDVAGLKSSLTVYQYLSATDTARYPLVWGGNTHLNTKDSTGAVYKSYDKLSWQTSSQTLYATNIQTNNIKNLSIGGGIYWNPYVESASDNSDAASITLVKRGVAGGTTLVLSQMNDTIDTIQFKTNTAARLYHNNYPILTTQNTYVRNNKGYINGTEITQVNNSDKVDNRHAISTIPNTGIIYKAAIYTNSSLTSYWVRLASIPSINYNEEFIATIHVQSGHYNPGRSAILLVYLRGNKSSFMSKSFKTCCNSNYDHNRFRLYYKDSDKTSEIWYQTTGQWDGIITTVISQSSEGSLYEGLTLYSGNITAVQTPSVSTYLSAQVSTITDNISGNASTATKLQTARSIWGQSFDGTGNVDGTLTITNSGSDEPHIMSTVNKQFHIVSKYKLILYAGEYNKNQTDAIHILSNHNVGIGVNPSYKLDVNGQMRAGGFHHSSVNSDNYILLAGGGYKSFGGDSYTPIFLGCLNLYHGSNGTVRDFFQCLGHTVSFSYTRGGNYCKITIPDTTHLSFYISAAIASVNYSGGGMDTWVGNHRGEGSWWLHCYAQGWNEVRVKGFHQANGHNDSWWGGNPLYTGDSSANKITVCIFGHVNYV